ncbi:hypothetical protein PR202_ga02037 [Eleusine coracana subsp. coracana]|uniref:Uncharacterized protein n=1 Tax=Eleusine coracana subsp. coracana TaxID=191504 RepID=A0AAV5BGS3_ELECO|nr:hypothetical protein PR202_ga01350 [Eleusine coracana subsp. coracana]GJM86203.1 hypothetical protein PR202_ga02037 [Eleusine coracana subsp. coracana]
MNNLLRQTWTLERALLSLEVPLFDRATGLTETAETCGLDCVASPFPTNQPRPHPARHPPPPRDRTRVQSHTRAVRTLAHPRAGSGSVSGSADGRQPRHATPRWRETWRASARLAGPSDGRARESARQLTKPQMSDPNNPPPPCPATLLKRPLPPAELLRKSLKLSTQLFFNNTSTLVLA